MKFQKLVVLGLVLLGTSAVALAVSRAVVRQFEAPTEAEAIELIAMLEPSAPTLLAQPAQQSPTARLAVAPTPKVTTIMTELDRMYAVRASVAESSSNYIITIGNDAVPDAYASHLDHVANLAWAEVRYNTLTATYAFPMTQIGTMWVTTIPKNLGFLPAHSVSLGAWEPGTSLNLEQDSVYWYTLTFE